MKTFTLLLFALILSLPSQAQVKKDNTITLTVETEAKETFSNFIDYLLDNQIYPAHYDKDLNFVVSEWTMMDKINVAIQIRAYIKDDKVEIIGYYKNPELSLQRIEMGGMKRSPMFLTFQYLDNISKEFKHKSIAYSKK